MPYPDQPKRLSTIGLAGGILIYSTQPRQRLVTAFPVTISLGLLMHMGSTQSGHDLFPLYLHKILPNWDDNSRGFLNNLTIYLNTITL